VMLDPSNRHASVVVANLSPEIEGGKFPAKRVVGERLEVQADIFKDGHDQIAAVMLWRAAGKKSWHAIPMTSLENDRWGASMIFDETGEYEIRVKAWSDDFDSWLHDFERRLTGDQSDFTTEVEEGRLILIAAAKQALEHRASRDAEEIEKLAETVAKTPAKEIPSLFEGEDVLDLVHSWPNTSLATESDQKLKVVVETHRSLFSSWYEFFPRSAKGSGTEHSTFNDCLERVKDAAEMGFDVVYLPPIHPIGLSHRKGKNNTLDAGPDDVGSPWAIGGKAGGHLAVEPALGTLMDFQKLVEQARDLGVEVALDFAINCSPDHPYVNEHPDWFYQRPDGTIKYAENPPKKYQDIYPLNFHGESWNELWEEMLRVVRFWISSGVRIFRVDNPHTKPVSFWHWLISEIHKTDPDIIFLSEAFTKPKMMQALAKIGFTQSYTYFTWRETKAELTEYVTELTKGEMRDYYRANFWP
ncbi:MAG: maltotransferase domain-containing protein, partial [Verrucomicrobiota bacterium]